MQKVLQVGIILSKIEKNIELFNEQGTSDVVKPVEKNTTKSIEIASEESANDAVAL